MIRALIFDMDGLLLDSERIVQRSWNIAGKDLDIPDLGEHIYNTLGLNRKARDEYFMNAFGPEFALDVFNQKTSDIYFKIVGQTGIPLKPGAKELLEYAKKHGYKTAVATSSSDKYAIQELQDAGIWHYFDGGIFGNMIQNTKPDPEIYLKACKCIGVNPCECLALEDAPAGIRSAHAAGLKVIAVPDLVQPDESVLALVYQKLDTLHEVIPLLTDI